MRFFNNNSLKYYLSLLRVLEQKEVLAFQVSDM